MCVYALVVLIMWRIRSRQREREREREMCVCKCVYCFLDKKSVPRWRSGSSPCDNRRYWSQFYRAHSYIRRPHLYTWTRSLNMIRSETLIQCRVCCRNWVRHWSYNTCQSMVQYDSCSCVEDALQLVCCLLRPTDTVTRLATTNTCTSVAMVSSSKECRCGVVVATGKSTWRWAK